jgi:hypothetical protein
MEIPPPDPVKLLQSWMEWEHGDVTPGRVMANLKTGGLRVLLEDMAAAVGRDAGMAPPASAGGAPTAPGDSGPGGASAWGPVV